MKELENGQASSSRTESKNGTVQEIFRVDSKRS